VRFQVTLTVAEGKKLIAKAVCALPEVRRARDQGRLLLMGGTTVSAVSEELGFGGMWISGRIDAHGCRATTRAAGPDTAPHNWLISGGVATSADADIGETVCGMTRDDVVVVGANVLDMQGRAAVAFAGLAGGGRGRALQLVACQGIPTIVAVGLEKLVPGTVARAVQVSGRVAPDGAMGCAVGLHPVDGKVVTELESFQILYGVTPTVIAGGGLSGGEGSKTFVLEGTEEQVRAAARGVRGIKGAKTSGADESLRPCFPGCPRCERHAGCVYHYRERALAVGWVEIGG
jgi:hypothetical protein